MIQNMIQDLKLSKKLAIGFGALITSMVLMAVVAAIAMGIITEKVIFIRERSLPVLNASW